MWKLTGSSQLGKIQPCKWTAICSCMTGAHPGSMFLQNTHFDFRFMWTSNICIFDVGVNCSFKKHYVHWTSLKSTVLLPLWHLHVVFTWIFTANNQYSTMFSGGVPGSVLCYCVPDLHALQEHVWLWKRHIPCGVPVGASHWVVLPRKLCFYPTGGKEAPRQYNLGPGIEKFESPCLIRSHIVYKCA